MSLVKWRTWLPGAVLLAATGCGMLWGEKGPPEDPLFVRKEPTRVKAQLTPPTTLAYSEPSAPADPFLARHQALVAQHADRPILPRGFEGALPDLASPGSKGVPATLTNRSPEPERD